MEYCKRCCYPANAKPTILFDEQGVCSGCRLHESRPAVDWDAKWKQFQEILKEYSAKARANGSTYDLIIPVSGGKDSHYQVHCIKELGYNPLLVCYNHGFNTKRGIRNLTNMLKQFNCDLLRFTTSPEAARVLSKFMLKTVGDITWHYHAGIMTFPIKSAVMYKIPLILWGEHGRSDRTGMYNQSDMLEFSKKDRQEHSMRGFEPDDILRHPNNTEVKPEHVNPFYYPSDKEIESVGVRGIYLSNYISWNDRKQTKEMIETFGFETAQSRERTYSLHAKLDDIHANGTHDFLKYLKFGYGRATDDTTIDIRHGRMTREEGIAMVAKYDHVRPSDLDIWLKFTGMTEQEFLACVDHLRDPLIWEKDANGQWKTKDSIANHIHDAGIDDVRLPRKESLEILRSAALPGSSRDDHILEDTNYIWL
ncbi:N-acetyl sugar amidotransferase [Candidatus Peregrinibacteria bacterium]|nr:N-acetyl sugar amidotransferase [Candidatus Peregrinibacteria bacterium]